MFKTELQNIIYELEKIRDFKGLNRIDMAADVGISKSTYYRWCNGELPRSMAVIDKANAYLEGYYGVE